MDIYLLTLYLKNTDPNYKIHFRWFSRSVSHQFCCLQFQGPVRAGPALWELLLQLQTPIGVTGETGSIALTDSGLTGTSFFQFKKACLVLKSYLFHYFSFTCLTLIIFIIMIFIKNCNCSKCTNTFYYSPIKIEIWNPSYSFIGIICTF